MHILFIAGFCPCKTAFCCLLGARDRVFSKTPSSHVEWNATFGHLHSWSWCWCFWRTSSFWSYKQSPRIFGNESTWYVHYCLSWDVVKHKAWEKGEKNQLGIVDLPFKCIIGEKKKVKFDTAFSESLEVWLAFRSWKQEQQHHDGYILLNTGSFCLVPLKRLEQDKHICVFTWKVLLVVKAVRTWFHTEGVT